MDNDRDLTRRPRLSGGFTLAGTLTGLAVTAALVVFCAPLVTRKIERRAIDAEESIGRTKAAIAGALDDFASGLRASNPAAEAPAPERADAAPAWADESAPGMDDTCLWRPPVSGLWPGGACFRYFPPPRRWWFPRCFPPSPEPGRLCPAPWGRAFPPARRARR